MSKEKQPIKSIKQINLNEFHLVFDGSKTGHPAFIIWKDDQKNQYLAIKFGSSPNKNNKEFKYPLSGKIKQNFVYKRLFLGKRSDFSKIILTDLKIEETDVNEILNSMDFLNPVYSKSIKSKDKKYFKWIIKKNPLYQGQLSDPKGPM